VNLGWLPNAICVGRILLIAPVIVFLVAGQYAFALVLIVIAGVSDALDGHLAKTYGWRTRLGSLLDPVADKLLMLGLFVTLSWLGLVPVALTAIVILRDLVIVGGAIAWQALIAQLDGSPSAISKLNTVSQLGYVVFVVAHAAFGWPPEISQLAMGALVVFTTLVSGLHYVLEWAERARRAAPARS
jgi:cardiolipin synthase (CMP-forming)